MKRSIFTKTITWLCLFFFGMHVVLHIGPTFHKGIGHSSHGEDHHLFASSKLSDNPSYNDSGLGTGLNLNDYSETDNHDHHTPADHHTPGPEHHDPTHHLTIQSRATSQTPTVPFFALFQHRFLGIYISTTTQPSILCTGRDVATQFNPYVKCVRLIL